MIKKNILALGLIFLTVLINAQIKFFNVDFPNFDKSKIVKSTKTTKNVNQFTKKITQIIEYNQFGQQHGATITFRNDGSPKIINYYHNGKLIYNAVPFINSVKIQKIFNYDDYGSFDGVQKYIYLNQEKNEWTQATFYFKNGRLTGVSNQNDFPEYTINFVNGKLDGIFYFYDNLNCNCYYYGEATNGEINKIGKFNIRNDLTFEISTFIFENNKINYLFGNDYQNPKSGDYAIIQKPVILQDSKINIDPDKSKIVFNKQIDWLSQLKENSTSNTIQNREIEEIDLTDAMYGAPKPVTIPQTRH